MMLYEKREQLLWLDLIDLNWIIHEATANNYYDLT